MVRAERMEAGSDSQAELDWGELEEGQARFKGAWADLFCYSEGVQTDGGQGRAVDSMEQGEMNH